MTREATETFIGVPDGLKNIAISKTEDGSTVLTIKPGVPVYESTWNRGPAEHSNIALDFGRRPAIQSIFEELDKYWEGK